MDMWFKKMRKEIEEYAVAVELPLIFWDGYDDAIIGLSRQFNKTSVLYDKNKIIEILCESMSLEDALEYFEYNIVGAYVGEHTPTVLEMP